MHTVSMVLLGLAVGIFAKWVDFMAPTLGDVTVRLPLWVLVVLAIALLSSTPLRAAVNSLVFFLPLVGAYYVSAAWLGGAEGLTYLPGWAAAGCLAGAVALAAWYAFGQGWLPGVLSLAVLAADWGATRLLYGGVKVSDMVLMLLCAVLLAAGRHLSRVL